MIVVSKKNTKHEKISVAAVLFQQNEAQLLEFWLSYHTALFGLKNVAVLDNFSKNPETIQILSRWSQRGVIVDYKQGPYIDKGTLTTKAFRKHFPKHHIGIPLDGDEVVVAYRDNVPVINKTMILSDFEYFWRGSSPCAGMRQYFANVIVNGSISENGLFGSGPVYGFRFAKKYVRLSLLEGIDHGNHNVELQRPKKEPKKVSKSPTPTYLKCSFEMNRVGLLHYVNTGALMMLQKSIADCIGFGSLPPNITAENFRSFGDLLETRRGHFNDFAGSHKLARVVQAYDKGIESLAGSDGDKPYSYVGTFNEILHMIRST